MPKNVNLLDPIVRFFLNIRPGGNLHLKLLKDCSKPEISLLTSKILEFFPASVVPRKGSETLY